MLRKLTSEVLERRTVFSASAIVPLADAPAFMDYTDDAFVAAAPQTPAAPAVAGDFDGDGAVDGADFLVWRRGLSEGSTGGPTGKAADAVMEQIGRDPQGIIAILIGLYAPKPHGAVAQAVELENTLVSNFSFAGRPDARLEQASVPAASSAPQRYLQLELENTMVSSLVSPRDHQSGILHEDNEFSFPRM
ncbi:MAG: hypothetical protein U0836_26090 [Pirellulales bacterium]